ncbi:hypothetical protein J6590_026956 [Homalodisca vitripennis]|nr:hypothetical protein J6590_026956 [Homalodisca vitripennis]
MKICNVCRPRVANVAVISISHFDPSSAARFYHRKEKISLNFLQRDPTARPYTSNTDNQLRKVTNWQALPDRNWLLSDGNG